MRKLPERNKNNVATLGGSWFYTRDGILIKCYFLNFHHHNSCYFPKPSERLLQAAMQQIYEGRKDKFQQKYWGGREGKACASVFY